MICDICEHLQTGDGDLEKPSFFCKKYEKKIVYPNIEQKFCGKTDSERERANYLYKIQTDTREMQFIDRLTAKQLKGYIAGTARRDKSKTTFNIKIILTYAQERLEKLQNLNVQ